MNFGMETELVEFKKTTGELKEGMISLASMLNKNGKGVLYFGVRNDGEVLGYGVDRGHILITKRFISERSRYNENRGDI